MTHLPASRRPIVLAAAWLAFLGPFFFLVYGVCNWAASLRTDVPSFFFWWEHNIPFIPWMIVPYMSTDFLFALALFMCRDKAELQILAYRYIAAIGISAIFFLFVPLRFSFPRPEVLGLPGTLFSVLTSFDKPYNQAPSLHISLLAIQWVPFARNTSGVRKVILHCWFALIGLSTVFTYQHHIIDLYTGVMVAVLCFYLFPDCSVKQHEYSKSVTVSSTPERPHFKIMGAYLCGALLTVLLAWQFWQTLHLLLWPAAALSLIAASYGGIGTAVFLKSSGTLSLCSQIALAPYLLGAHLSFLRYTRGQVLFQEIVPGVLIGRKLNSTEASQAIRTGVTAVIDLTAEFSEAKPLRALAYLNLQTMDLTPPSLQQLNQAVAFIGREKAKGKTLVHCALGYARSACVVAAYLMAAGHASTVHHAVEMIRTIRPGIVLDSDALLLLERFRETLPSGNPVAA